MIDLLNQIFVKTFVLLITLSSTFISQINYRTEFSLDGNYKEERKLDITVYKNSDINFIVSKRLKPNFSIPESSVLKNGNLLLIHSLEGIIEIYDSNGLIQFENGFYNLPPYREQKLLNNINDNGITILFSENNQNRITQISNSGEILFNKQVEDGILFGLASSNDGRLIAYSLLNWKGDILAQKSNIINIVSNEEYALPYRFKEGMFNHDLKLFSGRSKRKIYCYDLISKSNVWERNFKENEILVDAVFNKDEIIFIKSETPSFINKNWNYEKSAIIQKKMNGGEILVKSISENTSKLELYKDNLKIQLKTDNRTIPIKFE